MKKLWMAPIILALAAGLMVAGHLPQDEAAWLESFGLLCHRETVESQVAILKLSQPAQFLPEIT